MSVPWPARRSNQSILKEISPGISLDGMMLKLKLQYFGHLMGRVDSLEKTLMLGGIGKSTGVGCHCLLRDKGLSSSKAVQRTSSGALKATSSSSWLCDLE